MKKKTVKILLSIFVVVYIILCLLSGFLITFIFNDSLTFCDSVEKETARDWGLSVYEDVKIEPNILNLPNGKMRLGNAFLVIGKYRNFTIPLFPLSHKYSLKFNTDWQRIQLRFDVIESPTGDILRTHSGPDYEFMILEDPCSFPSYLIYNNTAYAITVTKDRYKQYHGYIINADNKEKADETDFVITVSWDKALKDWGGSEKVWAPGYSNKKLRTTNNQ